MAILAVADDRSDLPELDALQLQAEDELRRRRAESVSRDAPESTGQEKSASPPSPRPQKGSNGDEAIGEQPTLDPIKLQRLVGETRRLHRELSLAQPLLREIRRMLRALLAEIDPNLPPATLAERVVKTLGYGAQIERRLAEMNASWSESDLTICATIPTRAATSSLLGTWLM
jgi:two-component system chemotaxis sensor kinase CheA